MQQTSNNKSISPEIPHQEIYQNYCSTYDRLRSVMDHEGNLLKQISNLTPLVGAVIVEFAAGAGKITGLLAPMAKSIAAFDQSATMIAYAREKFDLPGMEHICFEVADNRLIPYPDSSADLVIEGWSLGYIAYAAGDNWKNEIDVVVSEMERLLKPRGTAMVLGTLGTGTHQPKPPNAVLANLYEYLEKEKGFVQSPWFKTDYRFSDVKEASELTSFFWNKKFGEQIWEKKMTIVPECTAIWHKRKI